MIKLRHFIWKCCSNVIAVKTNLQRRGIRLETCCPLCEEDTETHVHLFFKCPFARVLVWISFAIGCHVGGGGGGFLTCWKWLVGKYGGVGEGDRLMRGVVCGLWRI